MSDILTTTIGAIDEETGQPIGPVRRPMTPQEETTLQAVRTKTAADDVIEAADVQRRATRAQLLASIADIGIPTWAQTEAGLIEARGHIARPLAQWTQSLMVDAIKLSLRMAVFLVGRELRRVAQNREPD